MSTDNPRLRKAGTVLLWSVLILVAVIPFPLF